MGTIHVAYISIIISTIALGVSISKYKFTKNIESFKSMLELESQLESRKVELDKLSKDVEIALDNGDEKKVEILQHYLKSGKENFYNRLDRIAFAVLEGYLKESELEKEYRDYIYNTIKSDPDAFNAATPYRNIKKIHDRWN